MYSGNKLVTFVVPSYNSEAFLHICVDSLLNTRRRDIEILIINDGSKDRTPEIADEYAAKYPDIVRAIHQENGGHGEGINHGLKEATGYYFKVVDSDDWLDSKCYDQFLVHLDRCRLHKTDLVVCNYIYDQKEQGKSREIAYRNVFPEQRPFRWKDIKHFLPWQYLTMHSSTFRTELLREGGIELPKHVFYEDNLFVYQALPHVKSLYYLDCPLYHYLIGRAEQSVSEANLAKNCRFQILVSSEIFKIYHNCRKLELDSKLRKYLYHELTFMMSIAVSFTRLNKSKEADRQVEAMWTELRKLDIRLVSKLKHASMVQFVDIPGGPGRNFGLFCYRLCHKIVPYN